VGNAKPITEEARKILLAKKNEKCDDTTIHRKMDDMDQLLGLLDSAYAYLKIFLFYWFRERMCYGSSLCSNEVLEENSIEHDIKSPHY
jgi:hypothetical protein